MLFVAVGLSTGIVIFFLVQARRHLSGFGAAEQEIHQLGKVIHQSTNPTELIRLVKEHTWGHSLAQGLVQKLLRIFSGPPCQIAGENLYIFDVEDSLHFDSLLKKHMQTRQVQMMPTLLTGLGIFFTFLGLTISTFGLDPSNAEGLSSSVRQLVGGMSLAFSTSLTGIGCSLIWTWKQKRIEQGLEMGIYILASQLQNAPFLLSENKWFILNQEHQTSILDQVPARLEQAMEQQFNRLLAVMPVSLNPTVHEEALQGIQSSVKEANQYLESLTQTLTNSPFQINNEELSRVEDMLGAFRGAIAGLDPIQENQKESVARLESLIEKLGASSEQALQSQKLLFGAQEEMNSNMKWIREYWQTYREQLHQLEASLNQGVESFQTKMDESMAKAHRELDEILGESLSLFSDSLKTFDQTIAHLSELVAELKTVPRKKGLFG